MSKFVTKGLVLRETAYKESDKMLTVYLDGYGKCSLKASGCKRKNSPLAASSQFLSFSEMTISLYKDRYYLIEAELIDEFRGIRSDLEKFSLASYFAEVTDALMMPGEDDRDSFRCVLRSLGLLSRGVKNPILIKAVFELTMVSIAGYTPQLTACSCCGERIREESAYFDIDHGSILCSACGHERQTGSEAILFLSPGILSAMRFILSQPFKRIFSFRLADTSLRKLSDLSERYLQIQIGKNFPSLSFYHSLGTEVLL